METILTLDLIEKWFNEFNAKYFSNKLTTPNFRITNTRRALGRFQVKGDWSGITMTISISTFFPRKAKGFRETLIHEMIHEEDYLKNGMCTGHGWFFKSECIRINRDGWNLATTTDLCEELGEEAVKKVAFEKVLKEDRYVGIVDEKTFNSMFVFCFKKKNLQRLRFSQPNLTVYEMLDREYFEYYTSTGNGNTLRGKRVYRGDKLEEEIMSKIRPAKL